MKHPKRQKGKYSSSGHPMPMEGSLDPMMQFNAQSMPLPPGVPPGLNTTKDTDSDGM